MARKFRPVIIVDRCGALRGGAGTGVVGEGESCQQVGGVHLTASMVSMVRRSMDMVLYLVYGNLGA